MPTINNQQSRGILALIALATAVLLVMLASDLNGGRIQDISLAHPGIDKLAHFGMHVTLVAALYAIVRRFWPQRGIRFAVGIAAGTSVLFGFLDESHQYFVGGRDFDVFDVAANLCGAATATILLATYVGHARQRLALTAIPLLLFVAVLVHGHTQLRHFNEGLQQIRAGDYAAARQSFLTALAYGHASPGLYNELAWIELEYLQVDPASALHYTEQALTYEPDNPDYLDTYGWALYRNGRYAEALEALLKAYAGNPDIFCIHYHLGATYHALGRNVEAAAHLTQQLTRSQDARFAEKARALLATLRGRRAAAG